MRLKNFRQRGQMMVFFALMIPVILLFLGLACDLGWYYFNVSKLQNAADAAALSGGQTLLGAPSFKESQIKTAYLVNPLDSKDDPVLSTDPYSIKSATKTEETAASVANKPNNAPRRAQSTETAADTSDENTTEESTSSGTVSDADFNSGNSTALDYLKKNLGNDANITITNMLYKDGDNYYYVTKVTEKIQHFFLPGWFDDMDASVWAFASLGSATNTPTLDPKKMNLLTTLWVADRGGWEKTITVSDGTGGGC